MNRAFTELEERLQQGKVLLGIDGRCASGKSTLGAYLAEKYDGVLLHMDDFFLRPEQRTAQRYATPGGNVDYERFEEEILKPYKEGKEIVYRPFDCSTFTLGEEKRVPEKKLLIVEGSYAFVPSLISYYDLKFFLNIDPSEQERRLKERNPEKWEMFKEKWIPLEELYFSHYDIASKADYILKMPQNVSES